MGKRTGKRTGKRGNQWGPLLVSSLLGQPELHLAGDERQLETVQNAHLGVVPPEGWALGCLPPCSISHCWESDRSWEPQPALNPGQICQSPEKKPQGLR